jgi:hypothetical protein
MGLIGGARISIGLGAEMSQHARLRIDAGVQVYFCDPHSPWQRGTNKNTNGLLRQYFRRAPTSMYTAPTISQPWRLPSMAGREKRSAGAPPTKPLTRCYDRSTQTLQRPVEPG